MRRFFHPIPVFQKKQQDSKNYVNKSLKICYSVSEERGMIPWKILL